MKRYPFETKFFQNAFFQKNSKALFLPKKIVCKTGLVSFLAQKLSSKKQFSVIKNLKKISSKNHFSKIFQQISYVKNQKMFVFQKYFLQKIYSKRIFLNLYFSQNRHNFFPKISKKYFFWKNKFLIFFKKGSKCVTKNGL